MGLGPVVAAESHDVLVGGDDPHGVTIDLQPGLVHRGAGELPVQGVIILRRGAAGGQQARVEGEAAVGADDLLGGPGLGEHVVHPQAHAVHLDIPDDLAHEGQDLDQAPGVSQPQRGHAGWVAQGPGLEVPGAQDGTRLGGEQLRVQGNGGHVLTRLSHGALRRGTRTGSRPGRRRSTAGRPGRRPAGSRWCRRPGPGWPGRPHRR